MKKIGLFLLILCCNPGYSQITLDFQSTLLNLGPIRLSSSETVYLDYPDWYYVNRFTLYHLDGTLYKTIYLPPKPDSSSYLESLWYISRTLFDNDPSNIEFLAGYTNGDTTGGNPERRVEIIREDGTILLDEPFARGWSAGIYSTEQGTKMMLSYWDNTYTEYLIKVFNLPGALPLSDNDALPNETNGISVIPNPNNGQFTLKMVSKPGEPGMIELYSSNGKLITTFKSAENPANINIPGLPDGLYFINARSATRNAPAKMVIQK
jgi:hypothetical protein